VPAFDADHDPLAHDSPSYFGSTSPSLSSNPSCCLLGIFLLLLRLPCCLRAFSSSRSRYSFLPPIALIRMKGHIRKKLDGLFSSLPSQAPTATRYSPPHPEPSTLHSLMFFLSHIPALLHNWLHFSPPPMAVQAHPALRPPIPKGLASAVKMLLTPSLSVPILRLFMCGTQPICPPMPLCDRICKLTCVISVRPTFQRLLPTATPWGIQTTVKTLACPLPRATMVPSVLCLLGRSFSELPRYSAGVPTSLYELIPATFILPRASRFSQRGPQSETFWNQRPLDWLTIYRLRACISLPP